MVGDELSEQLLKLRVALNTGAGLDDPVEVHTFQVTLDRLEATRTPSPQAELREALEEIAKGEGAFNRDPLIHAENTIENMKEIARAALRHDNPAGQPTVGGE